MFLDRVIHFEETLGDQVKGRSQKKAKIIDRASLSSAPESTSFKLQPKWLKSLTKVPNVAHLRVQAVSLNLNLVISP